MWNLMRSNISCLFALSVDGAVIHSERKIKGTYIETGQRAVWTAPRSYCDVIVDRWSGTDLGLIRLCVVWISLILSNLWWFTIIGFILFNSTLYQISMIRDDILLLSIYVKVIIIIYSYFISADKYNFAYDVSSSSPSQYLP